MYLTLRVEIHLDKLTKARTIVVLESLRISKGLKQGIRV
jgi:hypothetical protein